MPDDQVKVDVVVTGQNAVDRLDASIKDLKKQVTDLTAAFDAGKSSPAEYAREMGQLNRQIAQQEALLHDLKTRGGGAIGEFAHNYRTQILNMGRATQDFIQGGVGGILNNIEGLIKNPAVAGIGTIIAAALWAGWPTIKKWFDSFGEETKKLSDEALQKLIDQLDKAAEEFKKLKEAATPEEEAAAKDITGFLRRQPMAALAGAGVVAAIGRGRLRLEDLSPEMQEKLRARFPAAMKTDEEILEAATDFKPWEISQGSEALERIKRGRIAEMTRARELATRGAAGEAAAALLVEQAQVAGPAGEQARRQVVAATKDIPGLGFLQLAGDVEFRQRGRVAAHETNLALARNAKEARQKEDDFKEQVRVGTEAGQDAAKRVDEARAEAERAAKKQQHDADQARHRAEQDRKQTAQMFEHFDRMPGFMGLDAAAAEFAGMGGRQRAEHEQRLRRDARQALLMQQPQMAPEEATRRAAEFPGFLRQRYRGMEAEAVGAAQMQGIDVSDVAAMQGASEQQVRYNLARDQAARQAFDRLMQSMEHNNRQAAQSARQWDMMTPKSARVGDATGYGG